MKKWSAVFMLMLMVSTVGCTRYVANPKFDNCSNACSTSQNKCMLNASTADAVELCKSKLDACITKCESKHPRYFKR